MGKTRFLSFQTDLGKLRDAFMNASNGLKLVRIYPELHLTEELLSDLVLKPKERTSTSNNVGNVKQKLKDSIQSFKRFKDYSGIELFLHNGETCLNTLRELDSADRDFNVVILLNNVTQCRQLIYGQQRFPLFI